MAAPDIELRRVRALAAVTVPFPGYGMVPMDPDSKREELRYPMVPADAVETLVAQGRVADDVSEPAPAEKPAKGGKGGKSAAQAAPADTPADPPADADAPPA